MKRMPSAGDRAILMVETDDGELVVARIELDAVHMEQKGLLHKASGAADQGPTKLAVAGLTEGFFVYSEGGHALPT